MIVRTESIRRQFDSMVLEKLKKIGIEVNEQPIHIVLANRKRRFHLIVSNNYISISGPDLNGSVISFSYDFKTNKGDKNPVELFFMVKRAFKTIGIA